MTGPKRVFVLGAGFTKAYLPASPLLTDDYDGNGRLSKKFVEFPYALRLLTLEKSREDGKINLERLMTRLDAGMPYDSERTRRPELEHLLDEVKQAFLDKFLGLKIEPGCGQELVRFAAFCLGTRTHFISFNYDDLFDWALTRAGDVYPGKGYLWVRRTGYGFDCDVSEPCRSLDNRLSGPDYSYLLKLHGSFNWRIRAGHRPPYVPESIVHHETWYEKETWTAEVQSWPSLEHQPFIVPPVMTKSAIMQEPVLRAVWTRAYEVLEKAQEVVFVGYSLPTTDLASRFLFAEAIPPSATVTVVVKPRDAAEQQRIATAYNELLGEKRPRFEFGEAGARAWISTLLGDWKPAE